MYVIKDGNGKTEPITYTHHESYKGEARDIILSAYVVDCAVYDEYTTKDDSDDKEITLFMSDYFSGEEINSLVLMEEASEAFWDNLDVDQVKRLLSGIVPEDEIGDQIHQQRKDKQDEK